MAFDAHANLAITAVATPPSPASSGTTLVVTAGHGARFPAAPFNCTVWPATEIPNPATAEIVRVTARSTDTLTIARSQESTSARTIVAGDLIAVTITLKTLTDIEAGMNFPALGTADVGGLSISATHAAGVLRLASGGTTPRLTLAADGKVGIGTTSPVALLSNSSASDGNVTANGLQWVTANTDNYVAYFKTGKYGLRILDTSGTGEAIVATGNITILAGFFAGVEMTAPAAPAANGFRLYGEDNGLGKTRLMVRFGTGVPQQIAIEP